MTVTNNLPTQDRGLVERHPGQSWRSLLVLVLLTAVCVAGLNLSARTYLDARTPNLGYFLVGAKWRLLGELSEPMDILVVGDSSGNQSFNPKVFRAETGLRALNLGTLGNFLTIDDAWMLDEYIERFGPPKAVIVIHVYDMWHRRLRKDLLGKIPRSFVMRGRDGLGPKSAEEVWDLFRVRYLPFHAENRSLGRMLMRPWAAEGPRFTIDENGFMAEKKAQPVAVKGDARGHIKDVLQRSFKLSPEARQGLEKMCGLAEAHGFPLIVANGPTYRELASRDDFKRYHAALNRSLNTVVDPFPHAHRVPDVFDLPGDELVSVDHATERGAEAYTRRLVKTIRPLLD